MASFLLPTSIQKRLLRYALSRLELLDTDALDLDRLDISWGSKSTLEFRDVGLRLKVFPTDLYCNVVKWPRAMLIVCEHVET
jgi:autophagy-related protein 2